MMSRLALGLVVIAAATPGLLFWPVFGLPALALPLAVVAATTYATAEAARRWPTLATWRPAVALFAGLLGIVETLLRDTTTTGLPTATTGRALLAGVTESWQLTLQSTWPARPDAELLLFVPLAALAAAVIGVELLDRLNRPLLALLPALAVLGLSQAYVSLTGPTATAVGLGFAVVAGGLLVTTRGEQAGRLAAMVVAPTVVLAVVGAAVVSVGDTQPAYSLRQNRPAPVPPQRVDNPLDQVAARMLAPDEPVFSYTASGPVDRWRLVVLDSFNGVTWSPGGDYRRMGASLTPPARTDTTSRRASVELLGAEGPWVPSQPLPAEVTGVAPLVDEHAGTLIVPDRRGLVRYGLNWWEPNVDPDALYDAGVDPTARSGLGDLGVVPPDVADLARKAAHGIRPSFRAALLLEDFLSENYLVASGEDLPTGNGWPQLSRFLLETKRGTSEQFAAAYVVLSRILGLPARIVVGYRAPEGTGRVTVHNKDVLAWPEVAVAGVGWVPLDPSGAAKRSAASSGLAGVTEKARSKLPPPDQVAEPDVPDDEKVARAQSASGLDVPVVGLALAAAGLVVLWLVGAPFSVVLRRLRRRRLGGARAVVGAWAEVRDRLRAHGMPITAGMTVRDLAVAAESLDEQVVVGLHRLARSVDEALWSVNGPDEATVDDAWDAVRAVRRGLKRRPLGARLRAALRVPSGLGRASTDSTALRQAAPAAS